MTQVEDTLTVQALINLGACDAAVDWAREQGPLATGQDLWDRCPKGQWALWFLVRVIPGHAEYHTFIRRVTVRALGTGLTFDKPADPKLIRLRETIEAKEAWISAASPEDLKARILWDKEASWQQAFTAVLDNSQLARESELNRWVRDLHELFPIKVFIQEKKGKWVFKANLVELPASHA